MLHGLCIEPVSNRCVAPHVSLGRSSRPAYAWQLAGRRSCLGGLAHRKAQSLCLLFEMGSRWWLKKMSALVQLTCPLLEIKRWLVCACSPDAGTDDDCYSQGFADLLLSCHKCIKLHLKTTLNRLQDYDASSAAKHAHVFAFIILPTNIYTSMPRISILIMLRGTWTDTHVSMTDARLQAGLVHRQALLWSGERASASHG